MSEDAYYHALDRGYSPIGHVYGESARSSHTSSSSHQSGELVGDMFKGMSIKNIGISTPPMKDQVEALKSRIFQGASKVELGFMGQDKGSMGQGSTVPDMYSREMRQAMKELAKVNEVKLTTHVTPSLYSWCGLNPRAGKFDKRYAQQIMNEVYRTVDFAADVTQGGAIVIHTGEFDRSLVQHYEGQFEFYPEEKKEIIHRLVDEKTGEVISIPVHHKVFLPKPEYTDEGKIRTVKDELGNDLLDELGKPIAIYELDTHGQIKLEEVELGDFIKKKQAEGQENTGEIVKEFYKEQMMAHIEQSMGQALQFGDYYFRGLKDIDNINDEIKSFHKMKEILAPEDFAVFVRSKFGAVDSADDALKLLRERQKGLTSQLAYGREALMGGLKQRANIMDQMKRIKPMEEYAVKKSSEAIAQMGMYTWERTLAKQKVEKDFKPLFIAPENIFPEQYGSHPEELKTLVLGARKNMVDRLKYRGITGEEAEKLASTHIRATFDIGHVYVWRKYFKGSDQEFDSWIMDQLDDLNKHDVIGHLHVSDNFGYSDEHVTPGMGKVPIKEFIEKMREAGHDEVVVEPAHQDYKAMLGGWRTFGGSIYGLGQPGISRDRWTDIEHSYFGNVGPPQYIVGDYSPSQDFRGAPFYTGVPFE